MSRLVVVAHGPPALPRAGALPVGLAPAAVLVIPWLAMNTGFTLQPPLEWLDPD
jgi:hypothetical protein